MKNNYASVVNAIGLIALLLGVFLTFGAIKADLDSFNANKDNIDAQHLQFTEMMQVIKDYKSGIGDEELLSEDLAYLITLPDSTLASYSVEFEKEYSDVLTGLKSQMWNDIFTSSGKQISLILLGIALIFVAKALNGLRTYTTND